MSDEVISTLAPADQAFLRRAVEYLERPSFLMRSANLLGKPIETIGQVLPERVRDAAAAVVDRALAQSLAMAVATLPAPAEPRTLESVEADLDWHRIKHNVAAGVSGALAGGFGVAALALELPITTTIMMRDIASVAHSLGEDLADPEVKLQCLAVFSLGGAGERGARPEGKLSAMESSYYATRLGMSNLVREAAQYAGRVTARQLASDLAAGSSPVLVRLIGTVASRFNLVVSEKLLAQAVPAIGAVGGALVNVAFNAHFDRVARFHFGIRSLERTHGREAIQAAYQATLKQITARPPSDDVDPPAG